MQKDKQRLLSKGVLLQDQYPLSHYGYTELNRPFLVFVESGSFKRKDKMKIALQNYIENWTSLEVDTSDTIAYVKVSLLLVFNVIFVSNFLFFCVNSASSVHRVVFLLKINGCYGMAKSWRITTRLSTMGFEMHLRYTLDECCER